MTDYEYILQDAKLFHYKGWEAGELRKCVDMLPNLTHEELMGVYTNRWVTDSKLKEEIFKILYMDRLGDRVLIFKGTGINIDGAGRFQIHIAEFFQRFLVVYFRINGRHGVVVDPEIILVLEHQHAEILDKRGAQGSLCGMGAEFVKKVFESVHEESVRQQMEIINK